jgi:hypothetical protein
VGGKRSQRPGPSPTLGSFGPSHHWRHKSRVSLRGPPCFHGVSGIPFGEVRDISSALFKFKCFHYFPLCKVILNLVRGSPHNFPVFLPQVEEFLNSAFLFLTTMAAPISRWTFGGLPSNPNTHLRSLGHPDEKNPPNFIFNC